MPYVRALVVVVNCGAILEALALPILVSVYSIVGFGFGHTVLVCLAVFVLPSVVVVHCVVVVIRFGFCHTSQYVK